MYKLVQFFRFCFFWIILLLVGCHRLITPEEELSDKEYNHGLQLSHEGRDNEALVHFLDVIHRHNTAPHSHLCAGRIYLDVYNDPVYAIYHFREFLLQSNDAKEKAIVAQLINTAKKKFIKDLPGINSTIDSRLEIIEVAKQIREENISLKRMLKELQDRCNMLEAKKTQEYRVVSVPKKSTSGGRIRYIIQPGDTLSTISRKYYGSAAFWKKIFEANQDQIPYPNALTVGQEIIIP